MIQSSLLTVLLPSSMDAHMYLTHMYCVLPSDLYLFRNDRRVPNLVEQMPNAVEYRDFGILYSVVNRLTVLIPLSQTPIILRLYPALSLQVMGCRMRRDIAATLDFGVDLWGPSTICSEHIQDVNAVTGFT